jgi:Zn-dependent membrane protease YugP
MYLILILIVPTFLLGLYARARIAGAYKKNSRIQSRGRITGAEAARSASRWGHRSRARMRGSCRM